MNEANEFAMSSLEKLHEKVKVIKALGDEIENLEHEKRSAALLELVAIGQEMEKP